MLQGKGSIDVAGELIGWLGVRSTAERRCLGLALSREETSTALSTPEFDWLGAVSRAEQLELTPPHPLMVVVLDDENIEPRHAEQVLGRLRDVGGGRVLLAANAESVLTERELLALGFVRKRHPTLRFRLYLHDPDDYFPAREWNNAEGWANPQNYSRYRW